VFDKSDGVEVEKVKPLVYRVAYAGKQVIFELNDLSNVKPPAQAIGSDEKFLGPVFDESGIRFFLMFNPKLKVFHYILDETVKVTDQLTRAKRTNRILIGQRTGFAFYHDLRLDRKILIGVFENNATVNNYFDGPFDQLPDNFVQGDELREAILAVDPSLKGEIDRFGGSPDGATRFLIGPYQHYTSENDLYIFHQCATSKRVPREAYYQCFAVGEADDSPGIPLPFLAMKTKAKQKSKSR
jgi:hypothetical protein